MRSRGFTLVEMVVALCIMGIIVVFATMFLSAPVDAYEAQSRRTLLMADAATAWPRMAEDLRQALPNSARARRNGNYVVLEMLYTEGHARYASPPNTATFTVAGTVNGIFGAYAAGANLDGRGMRLSVNNQAEEAYTQTASMTPPLVQLRLGANAFADEAVVQLAAPPALNTNSPRSRIYLVSTPVTYLCDERLGTLRRYWNYPVAASQVARDTPGEFAGAASELVARGISRCVFDQQRIAGGAQIVSASITATRSGESVTLLNSAPVANLP